MNKNINSFSVLSNDELESVNIDVLTVPDSSKIKDTRSLKDFKTVSFGGPLKTQIITAMNKSIAEEKLEGANYWAFQLLLSGSIQTLFDKLISIAAKQINISNPKLPQFIQTKIEEFNILIKNPLYQKDNSLRLRNNQEMRHLIVEMVSLLTLSRKRKLDTLPKINMEDFNIIEFRKKLEAKNTDTIKHILKEDDPSEIRIAANEFLYQLEKKNITKTLYWLSWMLQWEKIHIKKYKIFKVSSRYNDGIDSKFSTNIIWLIWEIINHVKKSDYNLSSKSLHQLNILWDLYKLNFTIGSKSKKMIYILWSIKYLTSKCDWNLPLIEREYLYFNTIANINIMIQKIKPHEINRSMYEDNKYKININNNYISTENTLELEAGKQKNIIDKEKQKRLKEAKKKKISIQSLDKIDKLREIDKFYNL